MNSHASALLVLALTCLTPAAHAASEARPLRPGSDATAIDRNLQHLASALARELRDEELRTAVGSALSGGSERVYLAEILAQPLADGTLLGERLARSFQPGRARGLAAADLGDLFETMPGIELFVPLGHEAWEAGDAARVTWVPSLRTAEEAPSVEVFDAEGRPGRIDPREEPGYPVLALSYRDLTEVLEHRRDEREALEGPEHLVASSTSGTCSHIYTYQSSPLFLYERIRDIHESGANGPAGYAYFAAAGSPKTGDLPSTFHGESGWLTNVWASNFQGPHEVPGTRAQWEWEADGSSESAWRRYPAIYCYQNAAGAGGLTTRSYTVMEHDEWFLADDEVGKVRIDHSGCKRDVFDTGASSGWSGEVPLPGEGDILTVRYKLFCNKKTSCKSTVTCPWGQTISCVSSGNTCSSGQCTSGPDWVECNGQRTSCPSGLPPIPDLPW